MAASNSPLSHNNANEMRLTVEEPIDDFYVAILNDSIQQMSGNNSDRNLFSAHARASFLECIKDFCASKKANLWNAAGGMSGTFVWILFYYAFTQLKRNVAMSAPVQALGYGANSLLQGFFANHAAKRFIRNSCIAEGNSLEDAEKNAKKYRAVYTLVDAQFEPNLDFSIALARWVSTREFIFTQEETPVFSLTEIAFMAACTLLFTCPTHLLMSRWVFGEVDLMESFYKIFILTMAFYFTDAVFDIDVKPGMGILSSTLPSLVGSIAMMGVAYLLVDATADKVEKALHYGSNKFKSCLKGNANNLLFKSENYLATGVPFLTKEQSNSSAITKTPSESSKRFK